MAFIKINGKKHTIPAGGDAKTTFQSLQALMPELANAKLVKDGENWKSETNFGKKG